LEIHALVLDFGGPVLKTPFELRGIGEERAGLAAGTLAWTGPFDPTSDADWRDMQAEVITEREYWQRRSNEFAELTGSEPTFRGMMEYLFDIDEDLMLRAGARALVSDAKTAGYKVAVLTNDMKAFHGQAWVDRMTILRDLDTLVDGSVEHVLKPHPEIYELLVQRLGVPAEYCLFVDDQPANVAGAQSVGMQTIWFDVLDPESSYGQVRETLGLSRFVF
jgi:putative hydrolase of the HAD superfamily